MADGHTGLNRDSGSEIVDFGNIHAFFANSIHHKYCRYIGDTTMIKASIEGATVLVIDNKNHTVLSYKTTPVEAEIASSGFPSSPDERFQANFILANGELRDIYKYASSLDHMTDLVNILLGIYKEGKCPVTHNPIQHGFLIGNNGSGYTIGMVNVADYIN